MTRTADRRRRPDVPLVRRGVRTLDSDQYWTQSMRPLHVLVFLLPLIVAYEIGSIIFLTDPTAGVQKVVEARRILDDFFTIFGVFGFFIPGFAMVTVLVVWHVMTRDPWDIRGKTLGGMFAECVAWTLPILVLAAANNHAKQAMASAPLDGAQLAALAQTTPVALDQLHTGALLTIAIGAGLYEEMLFRLVGLALLHFILRDLIQFPEKWASGLAITLSALAFAAYHRPDLPAQWPDFLFYSLAGVYLGIVYVLRGFGVVVGTHAMYDVVALVLLK